MAVVGRATIGGQCFSFFRYNHHALPSFALPRFGMCRTPETRRFGADTGILQIDGVLYFRGERAAKVKRGLWVLFA